MLETLLNSPVLIYETSVVKFVQISTVMLLQVVYLFMPVCIPQFH